MEFGLTGKQFLLTAGSKDIGLACVKAFVAPGCSPADQGTFELFPENLHN